MTSSITSGSRSCINAQRTRLHILTILALVMTLLFGRASCYVDPLDCGYDEDNDGIVQTPGTPVCSAQDRLALLAFKASISSDPKHALAHWQASIRNCCSWNGVTCDGATGRVVRVKLYNQNLKGTLSPQLSGLSSLQVLHLDNNDFFGSIPSSFGNFGKLQRLCLSVNPSLSGPIPESFDQLRSLQLMDLRSNSLSGPLPASFGKMSNLMNIHLYGNKITGPIPPSFGLLSKLYNADLGSNQISGRIPDAFGHALSSLGFLFLGNNRITGLPADLRNLTRLQWLELSNNPIMHGDAVAGIATLPLIVDIELSSCQISGPFPTWVARLRQPDRHLLSDEVTPSLNLGNNAISGSIPSAVGKLTYLQYLRLENNKLTGPIPASFAQLQNLRGLNVSYNQLSGRIPQVKPFTTFGKSAYTPGNPGLCGLPLKPCKK
ncbi:hypothetical protein L7F22_014841 [Adiantum nelumboides]|nr:hypothetical protein [Adiantum nelumboides]